MCNRIRIRLMLGVETASVHRDGDRDVITIPIDSEPSRFCTELKELIDLEQIECVKQLFATDFYPREYEIAEDSVLISCISA